MKIVTIIGARPQFIKAAIFSAMLKETDEEIIIHTGQHYDNNMSDIFFQELNLPKPKYNLSVGSSSHGKQTGQMLEKIEQILIYEQPQGVLVYGDTNSTLAGALAASKLLLPIFHVEAGLRSYNKNMPEEQNRVLTDHLSDLLLCPTKNSVRNLQLEGITNGVFYTGDIMYDAVLRYSDYASKKYSDFLWFDKVGLSDIFEKAIRNRDYFLATVHRAENTDDENKIRIVLNALNMLSSPVIFPIHPRTRKIVEKLGLVLKNIHFIDPVGYLLMLFLTKNAKMVITDSGGVQKEAYLLKTPCTTLREETEWIETISHESNVLCKIEEKEIILKSTRVVKKENFMESNPFGDGKSAVYIYETIKRRLEKCHN